MDKAILEQEAKKLFGGAMIDIKPYQDARRTCWDVTIVPHIDKAVRFIRVDTMNGEAMTSAYLKKIQQNLLNIQKNTVTGIDPVQEPIAQEEVDEEIAKRLPQEKTIFICTDCNKKFKYAGPFALHKKKHKKPAQSVSSAVNDPLIYRAQ